MNVNLACAGVYVSVIGWINLDYASASFAVRRANLLGHLPLNDGTAALVYSPHFLEHIPHEQVKPFQQECFRILKPGGVLRLVVPDLETLCRTYLQHRDEGELDKADFVVLELLDQCVRRQSGGELGRYYRTLNTGSHSSASSIAFVRNRRGEALPLPPGGTIVFDSSAATCLCRAPLDPWSDPAAARCLSRPKLELGKRGRAPSLALRFPQPPAAVKCQRLRFDRALHGIHQPPSRFPLPSARLGCRWQAAQGRRVAVHQGAEAPLTLSASDTSAWGGRHG
jgi:SAM-dependent methyltransferase